MRYAMICLVGLVDLIVGAYSVSSGFVSVVDKPPAGVQLQSTDPAAVALALTQARSAGVAFMQQFVRPHLYALFGLVILNFLLFSMCYVRRAQA
jgi:hypothetical protein